MIYKKGERMGGFLGLFVFYCSLVFYNYFGGIFNKTVIPLALVGYKMIIANSYPTRAHGIIVK